jgi:Predicted membrane protein (DUF2127)
VPILEALAAKVGDSLLGRLFDAFWKRPKLSIQHQGGTSSSTDEGVGYAVVVRNRGERKALDATAIVRVDDVEANRVLLPSVEAESELKPFYLSVPRGMCDSGRPGVGRLPNGKVTFELLHRGRVVARAEPTDWTAALLVYCTGMSEHLQLVGRVMRAIYGSRGLLAGVSSYELAKRVQRELDRVGVGAKYPAESWGENYSVQAWRNRREEPFVLISYDGLVPIDERGEPEEMPHIARTIAFRLPSNITAEAAMATLPKRRKRSEPPLVVHFRWKGRAEEALLRLSRLPDGAGPDAFFDTFPEFGYDPVVNGTVEGEWFLVIAPHSASRSRRLLVTRRPFIRHLIARLGSLHRHELQVFGVGALAYGVLELVEGVGLWLRQRWAEWLTVVATSLLVPLELYELIRHPSALKAVGLAVNILIVVYLVHVVRQRGNR